jgi:hypothetical protein
MQNREQFATAIAAALIETTGQEWALTLDEPHDGRVNGATITRPADGFTLRVGDTWGHDKNGVSVGLYWPLVADESHRWQFKLAAGQDYTTGEPEARFSLPRPHNAATVARRIMRELITPETVEAFAYFIGRNERTRAEKLAAVEWRNAVAEASGLQWQIGQHDSRLYWRTYETWADDLQSKTDSTGGKITIRLPDDPARAADLVARLRAAVEASGQA